MPRNFVILVARRRDRTIRRLGGGSSNRHGDLGSVSGGVVARKGLEHEELIRRPARRERDRRADGREIGVARACRRLARRHVLGGVGRVERKIHGRRSVVPRQPSTVAPQPPRRRGVRARAREGQLVEPRDVVVAGREVARERGDQTEGVVQHVRDRGVEGRKQTGLLPLQMF